MELIPLPNEKKYLEQGPIRQKMGRILLYVIQKFSCDRVENPSDLNYDNYAGAHKIIYDAWIQMNEDPEFCEQVEIYLPVFHEPPDPSCFVGNAPEDAQVGKWLGGEGVVASQTYLTKETLQKAVKSFKLQSEEPEYAKYEDFQKNSV